jgi:hypothetical protein
MGLLNLNLTYSFAITCLRELEGHRWLLYELDRMRHIFKLYWYSLSRGPGVV